MRGAGEGAAWDPRGGRVIGAGAGDPPVPGRRAGHAGNAAPRDRAGPAWRARSVCGGMPAGPPGAGALH